MTPFGQAATAQPEGESGERYEQRTLVIVEGDEKKTSTNKVYWRVKDANNKWYSVWDEAIKIRLETAADSGEPVKCAIQIKPGNDPKRPFYTITGTDAAADGLVEAGNVKATQAAQPGGRNSVFGKRMHPDDALRVTNLACQERAIQMVALTIADKPEGVTYETFVKAKTLEYVNFLSSLLAQPLTPTPVTKPEQMKNVSQDDPGPDTTMPDDDDIPW